VRYLIKISYDGTGFIGWQKQKRGRSVQSVMENALAEFCGKPTSLVAAGRTDTGVHALAQYAHFEYEGRMNLNQILLAFRRWLPDDVKVLQIWQVSDALSARYQAYERQYLYILSKDRDPFNRQYSGYIPHLKVSLKPCRMPQKGCWANTTSVALAGSIRKCQTTSVRSTSLVSPRPKTASASWCGQPGSCITWCGES
jgi:tRNA pseudouridine(38-40) synthase